MQKSVLSNKTKCKILVTISVCAILLSSIFSFSGNFNGWTYFVIHLASVILGLFLLTVSALTFSEFRTYRLFLVLCAFAAITLAEGVSLISFIVPIIPQDNSLHSLIVHLMILLMLSFFSVGIFRTD